MCTSSVIGWPSTCAVPAIRTEESFSMSATTASRISAAVPSSNDPDLSALSSEHPESPATASRVTPTNVTPGTRTADPPAWVADCAARSAMVVL